MQTVSASLKLLNLFPQQQQQQQLQGNQENTNNINSNMTSSIFSLSTCSQSNIKLIWRGKLLVGDSSIEEGEQQPSSVKTKINKTQSEKLSYHYVRIETMGHFSLTKKRLYC